MKYKYHITCYDPCKRIDFYGSRCIYTDPYKALQAGVERIMRMSVQHAYAVDQHCESICVYNKDGKKIMFMTVAGIVNNL